MASGLSAGLPDRASAQAGGRLADALLGGRLTPSAPASSVPAVARYVSEQGPTFILDRSGSVALLRFENSAEVWALRPRPASRGDIVYYNDLNRMVLRATRLGGLILYTDARPNGLAATLRGAAPAIQLIDVRPALFERRLAEANVRLGLAAKGAKGGTLVLDVPPVRVNRPTAALIVDTATLLAEAFEQIAARPGGGESLNRVDRVRLELTDGPASITLVQGVLLVRVSPAEGVAGRPSSARMIVSVTGR